jgi:hypothetical protein
MVEIRRVAIQSCLMTIIAMAGGAAESAAAQNPNGVFSIAREVERMGTQEILWPGFDPLLVPLAIYTGERTYLFRHPSPPENVSPVSVTKPHAEVFQGRHPAVNANSSAELGGTVTATLLADGPPAQLNPTALAATALHEAFHVYQRQHHPGWSGDESALFLYPTEDAQLLALRRLESAALRRALNAPDGPRTACWARTAHNFRRRRFDEMDPAFSTYERLTELNEGLASYVQLLAAGKVIVEIPAVGFGPTEVRDRTYVIGPALALILDRLRPGWQRDLEAHDDQFLDQMVAAALETHPPEQPEPCVIAADEARSIEQAAREDAAGVIEARSQRRERFDALPGWRVVVHAADERPLWPQGFDPLNVERVAGGFLHTRFLRSGNDTGELEAIDEADVDLEALTEGVGPHPLFNGFRRVTVAGLEKPQISIEGDRVSLRAPGVTARFDSASVVVDRTEVIIRQRQQ